MCDTTTLICFLLLILARPLLTNKHEKLVVIIEALTSAPIIYMVYYIKAGRFYHFCNYRLVCFLGQISYSFYMFSSIAIYLATKGMIYLVGAEYIKTHGLIANMTNTFIAIFIAALMAIPCYKWLELPLMNKGKVIGDRIGEALDAEAILNTQ